MKILHVVPAIQEEASGPSYSVPSLARSLAERDNTDVELHTLAPAPQPTGPYRLKTYPFSRLVPRLGISPSMKRGLTEGAQTADVLHNHSLWMMPNIYPGWAVRRTRCRLVTSPRGTLAPWSLRRSRWIKRGIWWLAQGEGVRHSHCLHATAEHEMRDIRNAGLRAPVTVVPNGIDIPAEAPPAAAGRRRLLFLGRIHPVKDIPSLLQAWSRLQDRFPEWELVIAGPGDRGYLSELEQRAAALNLQRTSFTGPAYGSTKWEAYQQADLFVLPTHSENFGLAVAESLASGTPVVVAKGAPWGGVEANRCGWWIDQGGDALTECLSGALQESSDELRQRGLRGRAWMERDFSWDRVAQMMMETYSWLLGGGPPPSHVDTGN